MLLTLTYYAKNADDLGYLLHKNPSRPQQFGMSFGSAYVFYPVVEPEVCTAALLLDIDPMQLVRKRLGKPGNGLFDYVNDRPYVVSSFMSTALARVFGTAMAGRCERRPELVDTPLSLEARLYSLPMAGDVENIPAVFEPLGYAVEYTKSLLDAEFPQWGESRYIDLSLNGRVRLKELLNHLYVLIPVFDRQKHYWVDAGEVDKLIAHGEGWLARHPARGYITRSYFHVKRSFAHMALQRLAEEEGEMAAQADTAEVEGMGDMAADEEATAQGVAMDTPRRTPPLDTERLDAVRDAVLACGGASVLDLGCGEGKLIARLLPTPQIRRVLGVDVSLPALARAKARIEQLPDALQSKATLVQSALTYRDKRLEGFDVACLVEVIEHMDPARIEALERVLFAFAAPRTVIVTTPNVEYNACYGMAQGALRHNDHRFEWDRAQFAAWAQRVAKQFGYTVQIHGIGKQDEMAGMPTQMGVFTKCV